LLDKQAGWVSDVNWTTNSTGLSGVSDFPALHLLSSSKDRGSDPLICSYLRGS
jgi:hypothetical protein